MCKKLSLVVIILFLLVASLVIGQPAAIADTPVQIATSDTLVKNITSETHVQMVMPDALVQDVNNQ